MNRLELRNVSKKYARSGSTAVQGVTFTLAEGEILALVGRSGGGKTTTLRLIAGLEAPDTGVITIDGRLVAGEGVFVPPERRNVGMVFQEHALFPHLTVYENVAFGLHKQQKSIREEIVMESLRLVGLQTLAMRYPHALSGGERQRVALARALAPRPALLLFDEPFSSLDADMRVQMRQQVRDILKSLKATVVFVTHDQEEALFMGDRLAVFQDGEIAQIGAPEEIFHAPQRRFVAEFMGGSDFLAGKTVLEGIQTALGLLPQPTGLPPATLVEIALRADDVAFTLDSQGNGVIAERFFRGAFYLYRLKLDSGEFVHALQPHTELLPVGARVHMYFNAGHPLSVFHNGSVVQVNSPINLHHLIPAKR